MLHGRKTTNYLIFLVQIKLQRGKGEQKSNFVLDGQAFSYYLFHDLPSV